MTVPHRRDRETSGSISRRDFFKMAARIFGAPGVTVALPLFLKPFMGRASGAINASSPANLMGPTTAPARYWVSTQTAGIDCLRCHLPEEIQDLKIYDHGRTYIKCELCAQECLIGEGGRGRCRARVNLDGELRSLVYGHPVSVHVDPIEKKPFYHFYPGAEALSMATTGCPLSCKFCQNWEISQARPEDFASRFVSPSVVVEETRRRQVPIIAFTYNEPTVFAEYLLDIAERSRAQGVRNVMVSCGFMNPRPLADMCEALDAIKIDLKGFSNDFYQNVCGAQIAPVLRSIRIAARKGIHLEIVNLVVPTLNDSRRMLTELVGWILDEAGPDVPVHFTRFHPDYQMLNLPPTPIATLEMAYEIAREKGLRYPYVGNVPGHPGNHTYCPSCGKAVIERTGFFVIGIHLDHGRCKYCRSPVAGVFTG